jgi:small subunit ribosomal protein S9
MAPKKKQAYGLGRRKSAVARVWLSPGAPQRQVNNSPFAEYFPTVSMRTVALAPLIVTSQKDELALTARVVGGGKQAQADAIRLAASRALIVLNSEWRKQLKDAGMLTRDPRVKERKKFGLKRARRAPQFSKR